MADESLEVESFEEGAPCREANFSYHGKSSTVGSQSISPLPILYFVASSVLGNFPTISSLKHNDKLAKLDFSNGGLGIDLGNAGVYGTENHKL